jgi:glycosyltransferase involved in cell wall biosynthesis
MSLSICESSKVSRPYRFGFILNTVMGNKTRYLNLRKYAERDPDVDLVWAPVSYQPDPTQPLPYAWVPQRIHQRGLVMWQAQPVLSQMHQLDAVMIHLFEASIYSCVRNLIMPKPLIVSSYDDPPIVDPTTYPLYDWHLKKQPWRRWLRLQIDRWCAQRTSLFVPFSEWAANIYTNGLGISPDLVHPIHVGIDLELWQPVTKTQTTLPRILFVGGDFHRKGGDLLLEVFQTRFSDRAELHLVTQGAPPHLPPNVIVHNHLRPNDPRLTQLYADADIFVLPTRVDLSPFACLEAMASSCATIATTIGGIPDMVRPGETGLLMPVNDAAALGQSLQMLLDDPTLCRRFGKNGRRRVEQHFSCATTVPRILNTIKAQVDLSRSAKRAYAH